MLIKKKTNKEDTEIDKKKVNEVLTLSKKILKILYIFIIIIGIYTLLVLGKETRIFYILKTIIEIVAPLFIGIIIAWLFDPIVKKLQKKGIRRVFGTTLVYVVFIGAIIIIVSAIIPILSDQINEFVKVSLPSIVDTVKVWIDKIFDSISGIGSIDVENMKVEVFNKLGELVTGLTSDLPTATVNIIKSLFSGIGTIIVGLVIGFYLLLSFDSATDTIVTS